MSQENVETVQHIYDGGLMDRAVEAMRPLLAPDVEFVNPAEAIEPGTRKGIDAVIVAFAAVGAFETATSELRDLFPAGDSVVATVTFRARSRGSDVELTQDEAHTWTFRSGKVTRFEWCRDLTAALKAVGSRSRPTLPLLRYSAADVRRT